MSRAILQSAVFLLPLVFARKVMHVVIDNDITRLMIAGADGRVHILGMSVGA